MKVAQESVPSTESLRNPVWFREWFKIIMREWAGDLTMQQLAVVMFIFDRTAAWGKEWEFIRFSSFVQGITSKDGSVRYSSGVCNSEQTAMRITKELEQMGYLRKERTKLGNQWALNYDFRTKDNAMKKRKPASEDDLQASAPTKFERSHLSNLKGSILTTNVKERSKQNTRRSAAGTTSHSIEEIARLTKERASAARERRAAKKGGKLPSRDIIQLWSHLMRSAEWSSRDDIASGRLYLSKREAMALTSYGERFRKNYPAKKFREFLEWVINEWPSIRKELFSWMNKAPAPEAPAAMFIIRWSETIEQRYMQGLAFEHKLTGDAARVVKVRKTVSNRIESKPVSTRVRRKAIVALPSLDDDDIAKEYED